MVVVASYLRGCPRNCSLSEWQLVPSLPVPLGQCDPNPNPTPANAIHCPLGTTMLPPTGSVSSDQPVRDKEGGIACVTPADSYMCPAWINGSLDTSACQIDPACADMYVPLVQAAKGTWTCLALNPQNGTAAHAPVLTHYNSSVNHFAPTTGVPWGWFPDLSPLGLELREPVGSPYGTAPGSVLVPDSAPDLAEQCRNPPFLFSYDATHVSRTFEAPGLGPPTAYGRCDAGATARHWLYSEMGLAKAPIRRWHEICSSTFWGDSPSQGAVHLFDWQALYTNVTGCVGQVCLDMLAPGSNATACSARCSQYGDVKCSFSLDRYVPLLIHLAQLRVADLVAASATVNTSAQEAAVTGVQVRPDFVLPRLSPPTEHFAPAHPCLSPLSASLHKQDAFRPPTSLLRTAPPCIPSTRPLKQR